MKTYEVEAYYERKVYEKVWLTVEAESKDEAVALIKEGEGDWMDSKELDSEGEWVDDGTWEIIGSKPYEMPNTGDKTEEHN